MKTFTKKKSFTAPSKRRNSNNRKKPLKTIDPSLLVKKAQPVANTEYISERKIHQLPIHIALKEILQRKGFDSPTEIQDKTIEQLIQGKNMLGIAQTGTGKTGAFLIPIINQLIQNNTKSFALILVPTRELALQVQDELKSMTKGLKIFGNCFIGGTNINKDMQSLKRGSNIVIGTPGRVLDLVNRRALDLRPFKTLVLDEFDRMLDMGFINDVNKILNFMQQRRQTMLFSATLDNKQESIINDILQKYSTVKVSAGNASTDNVEQSVLRVPSGDNKLDVLVNLLKQEHLKKVIIFDETKHRVNRLCNALIKNGIRSEQIHGNKSQNARQNALSSFKKGQAQVLVATDVAARGIDVADITHVINYQIPTSYDSYIHRIGRTGRAGKTGEAITIIE